MKQAAKVLLLLPRLHQRIEKNGKKSHIMTQHQAARRTRNPAEFPAHSAVKTSVTVLLLFIQRTGIRRNITEHNSMSFPSSQRPEIRIFCAGEKTEMVAGLHGKAFIRLEISGRRLPFFQLKSGCQFPDIPAIIPYLFL
jgi:hypothetical protein